MKVFLTTRAYGEHRPIEKPPRTLGIPAPYPSQKRPQHPGRAAVPAASDNGGELDRNGGLLQLSNCNCYAYGIHCNCSWDQLQLGPTATGSTATGTNCNCGQLQLANCNFNCNFNCNQVQLQLQLQLILSGVGAMWRNASICI